jgi:hypothetical protein
MALNKKTSLKSWEWTSQQFPEKSKETEEKLESQEEQSMGDMKPQWLNTSPT